MLWEEQNTGSPAAKALRPSPEGCEEPRKKWTDLILLLNNLTGFWAGDVLEGEAEK